MNTIERNIKKNRWYANASWIIILMAALVAFYYFYLVFVPSRIIVMNKLPKVLEKTVVRGQVVHVEFNYCKYIDIPSFFTFSFLDHKALPILTYVANFERGCHVSDIEVTIPMSANTGYMHLLIIDQYRVNTLRTETYEWITQPFAVLQ